MQPDDQERLLTRQWIQVGVIVGILGDLAYAVAIAPLPLPDRVSMLLGFAFGPLLSLAFIGLFHFFRLHRDSILLRASVLYAIIAGTLVNVMIVVQSAIFETIPTAAREEMGLAWDGLNIIQLGLDISWDIYFSLAMMLLGLVMIDHPRFGVIWGGISLLIGGGLLILNLVSFPVPPASAGSFDLGPVSGLFFLFVSLRILFSFGWVDEQLGL